MPNPRFSATTAAIVSQRPPVFSPYRVSLEAGLNMGFVQWTIPPLSTAVPVSAELAPFSPATLLHTLHLYGAATVAAFGWAMCRLLDWDAAPWVPLWFFGALLVYNADRLRRDPADPLNVPRRDSAVQRFRPLSKIVTALSATVLVALPAIRRDWITLALVIVGAFICLNYSVPLFGSRLKDLPVLKTFVAPTIVAASIFTLPCLHEAALIDPALVATVVVNAWALLLFNMILCDLRDIDGDRRVGITSLPGALGSAGTRRLLLILLIAIQSLALFSAIHAPASQMTAWRILCFIAPIYLGALIAAVRVRRSERFYEWWVEGMFCLPAVAILGQSALG